MGMASYIGKGVGAMGLGVLCLFVLLGFSAAYVMTGRLIFFGVGAVLALVLFLGARYLAETRHH